MSLELIVPDFGLVWPQFVVFLTAIVLSLADAFLPKHLHYRWLTAISLVGYSLGLLLLFGQNGEDRSTFYGLFRADGLTVFLTLVILAAAILTVFVSASYIEHLEGRMPIGEFYTLLAFAVLGSLLTASAGDLVMLFVGIELSSLATYILTAFALIFTGAGRLALRIPALEGPKLRMLGVVLAVVGGVGAVLVRNL